MRKICVFTSTRADYGLLRNLIREIDNSHELSLQLLVSGTHLVADQGMTVNEIQADGYPLDHCVDIELHDDSPAGICNSMGVAISRYGQALKVIQPDILVILGDRFESFCCAAAATVCRIPIAHIHGGETTEGAIDEAFRHSISKMAYLHFASCETYRNRIIQLGEAPNRVFNVGALSIENIRQLKLLEKEELARLIGFDLDKPFFLITFHPVTLENNTAAAQFCQLTTALNQFPNINCIFTFANADTDGNLINKMIREYQFLHPDRCMATPSLGYLKYLSAMKNCIAVIGNSSSGIMEAPAMKVPTVNIGDRQKGRVRTNSIVDCEPDATSIKNAIFSIMQSTFRQSINNMPIPFEKEGTSNLIIEKLKSFNIKNSLKKKFYNLSV